MQTLRTKRQDLSHDPDSDLVALVLAGDGPAFAAIMTRYNQRLFRVARGVVRDEAEAEDVLQDHNRGAVVRAGRCRGRSFGRLRPRGLGRDRHQGGRARTATRAGQGSAISGTCRPAKEQRLNMPSAGSIGRQEPRPARRAQWALSAELCSARSTPSRSSRFGGESKNLTRPAERTGVRARSEHCFGGPAGLAEA
jgi:hypothetical protein